MVGCKMGPQAILHTDGGGGGRAVALLTRKRRKEWKDDVVLARKRRLSLSLPLFPQSHDAHCPSSPPSSFLSCLLLLLFLPRASSSSSSSPTSFSSLSLSLRLNAFNFFGWGNRMYSRQGKLRRFLQPQREERPTLLLLLIH